MFNKWQRVIILIAAFLVIITFGIGFIDGLFFPEPTPEEQIEHMMQGIFK